MAANPRWLCQFKLAANLCRAHQKSAALNDSLAGNESAKRKIKSPECMRLRNWLLPYIRMRIRMRIHLRMRDIITYKYPDSSQTFLLQFLLPRRRCCELLSNLKIIMKRLRRELTRKTVSHHLGKTSRNLAFLLLLLLLILLLHQNLHSVTPYEVVRTFHYLVGSRQRELSLRSLVPVMTVSSGLC